MASANHADHLGVPQHQGAVRPADLPTRSTQVGGPCWWAASRRARCCWTTSAGRNLYLLATGTGLAPFMSLVKTRPRMSMFYRGPDPYGPPRANSPTPTISRRSCPQNHLGEDTRRQAQLTTATVTGEPSDTRGPHHHLIETSMLFNVWSLAVPAITWSITRARLRQHSDAGRDRRAAAGGRLREGNNAPPAIRVERAFAER